MSENTKIEWCDHTFNAWEGCQKTGPGCDHCYAELRNARFGGGTAPNFGPGAPRRRTSAANWNLPKRWNAQADAFMAQHGRRQRVFCASLADVFDNAVDPQWRADLFKLIADTPNLDWLLLTKRIGNVARMIPFGWQDFRMPPNIWIGATIVNQAEADRDIPKLLAVAARVRFLSMEPLLGLVDIRRWLQPHCERHPGKLEPDGKCEVCESRGIWGLPGAEALQEHEKAPIRRGLDWVIVGGESGPGARPMHPDWACSLRTQCLRANVPFLFKQWGEWKPISQMDEAEHGALYKSKVIAKPHQDQGNLDDIYGRRCTVPTTILHADGSTHDITEPMAFRQDSGAMQIFHVGKKAAGRLLGGITWDGFPS